MIDAFLLIALAALAFGIPMARPNCRGWICAHVRRLMKSIEKVTSPES